MFHATSKLYINFQSGRIFVFLISELIIHVPVIRFRRIVILTEIGFSRPIILVVRDMGRAGAVSMSSRCRAHTKNTWWLL
jgi:hypothetical protein